jgi:diacylglycerol kinase (ATP)
MKDKIIVKRQGLFRLLFACKYSWQGLRSAIKNEEAFYQEFLVFITLTFISLYLDITALERLALIGSIVMVLIVELLNSAIECVVDRISLEHHLLSGRAKDYGSLAVLLSLLLAISTWVLILV